MTESALAFERYSLSLDSFRFFQDLDFSLHSGESVALVGSTGSGKSLLLRVMTQALWCTENQERWEQSGTLTILGENCSPERPSASAIASIQSRTVLLRDRSVWLPLSVAENFTATQTLAAEQQPRRYAQIVESLLPSSKLRSTLLSLAELQPAAVDPPYLQFLSVVRALIRKPRLLLLDEALVFLDPVLLRQAEHIIYQHNPQCTVLWATNDLFQASRVSDRTLFLNDGKIVEDAETTQFFTNPKTHEAERFVSGKEW